MNQSWRRRLAYGSNATLVTGMVVAVLVILYVVSDLYRVRWDLSIDAANTIDVDTSAKLELLDREGIPVTITAFTSQRGKEDSYFKNRAMQDLLTEFGHRSTAVQWRMVDFDKERLTAEKLGVNDYGRVVVERGGDRVDLKDRELFRRAGKGASKRVEFIGEAALSRAFSQILSPRRRVVYVLTGHGELDPEARGPDGLSELVAGLDEERYDVVRLDLLSTGSEGEQPVVPDDAALVFVARPQGNIAPQEEDILLGYLARGGPMLFAVDVGYPVPPLLSRMGIRIPEGFVLSKKLIQPYADRPEVNYKRHPINTDLMEKKIRTVVARAAAVVSADPLPEGVRASAVLSTDRTGWIERGGEIVDGRAVYEQDIDGAGPVDLAVALELLPGKGIVRSSKSAARVLVVGDGDLFSNSLMTESPGNATFAMDSIHWLAGEDLRLGLASGKATATRRLALTAEETGLLQAISLGLMPLVVTFLGLGVWASRRGR